MADRYAPEGKVWLCMMCGKTAKDYCTEERGWDESCALNCILVDEATERPTDEQAREFVLSRTNRINGLKADSRATRGVDLPTDTCATCTGCPRCGGSACAICESPALCAEQGCGDPARRRAAGELGTVKEQQR